MAMTEKTASASPLLRKLDEIEQRLVALQDQLNDAAFVSNPTKLVAASKESGQIEPVVTKYRQYKQAATQVEELREMSGGADREMADLAQAEFPEAQAKA